MAKLWGGRFQKSTDRRVDDFNSSIRFDKRMYAQDIRGSIAHANMLGRQGIIPQADAEKIVEGLRGILDDINAGKVEFLIDAEDIHMNVEKLLTDRIGEAGKRLHTGSPRILRKFVYFSFLLFIIARTLSGSPNRLIKPAASLWL